MPSTWKPEPGQVTLIEISADTIDCISGVVLEASGDPVVVDLTTRPWTLEADCEVVARFFAPDALYRTKATLSLHDGSEAVIELSIHDIERVQRRMTPRAALAMPVLLANFDDPGAASTGGFVSVLGDTIDIGEGGCRVHTSRPFPSGSDPTLTLQLPSGDSVVAVAAVLEELTADDGGREYRLVFTQMEDLDHLRLAQLVAAAPA